MGYIVLISFRGGWGCKGGNGLILQFMFFAEVNRDRERREVEAFFLLLLQPPGTLSFIIIIILRVVLFFFWENFNLSLYFQVIFIFYILYFILNIILKTFNVGIVLWSKLNLL